MNDLLKIGQVCELYGISADTLRYYDKKKILVPITDSANGYRYYTLEHLDVLEMILMGKYLEIPLEQLKTKMDEENINGYLELMEMQSKVIQEKAEMLKKLSIYTKNMIKLLKQIQNFENDWTFSKGIFQKTLSECIYFIKTQDLFRQQGEKDSLQMEELEQWMAYDSLINTNAQEQKIGLSVTRAIRRSGWDKELQALCKIGIADKIILSDQWKCIEFWGDEEMLIQYVSELCEHKKLNGKEIFVKFRFALLHSDMHHEYFVELYFRET